MTIFWICLTITLVGLWVISPFVADKLASEELGFFTKVTTGTEKFWMKGKTLHKVLTGKPTGLFSSKGLWWIGWPPFNKIHKFMIKKEKEGDPGDEVKHWIKDGGVEEVTELRKIIPRPFTMIKTELKDKFSVDLAVSCIFEVIDAEQFVFYLKCSFVTVGSMVVAAVGSIINGSESTITTIEGFIEADKGESSPMLAPLKIPNGDFNISLVKLTGLRLIGISIPISDPSDAETRKAIEALKTAKKLAEAKVEEAKGDALKKQTLADADLYAAKKTAEGKKAGVEALLAPLVATGATSTEVITAATSILETEALPRNLTTFVQGGKAKPRLNIP